MARKIEDKKNPRRSLLWTMQSKDARKTILNQYVDKYVHNEEEFEINKIKDHNTIAEYKKSKEKLNEAKDVHQCLVSEENYCGEENKVSNVLSLREFLGVLSIAYLGSTRSDINRNDGTDCRTVGHCELLSNLMDVSSEDMIRIIDEIPSIRMETNAGDGKGEILENDYFYQPSSSCELSQTPSQGFIQSEDNQSPFSIKVELSLKNSRSILNENDSQSQLKIPPDTKQKPVDMNNCKNPSVKQENVVLDTNIIHDVSLTNIDPSQGRFLNSGTRLKSFQPTNNAANQVSTKAVKDLSHLSYYSNLELNRIKIDSMNATINRNLHKKKQILTSSNKINIGNETKFQREISETGKEKHRNLNLSLPLCKDEVEINVCDSKGTIRKYKCSQNLLISKMGYFAQISNSKQLQDFEIIIHTDPDIFEWIISWINSDSHQYRRAEPALTFHKVIPVLISASMFQIESLIESCLDFCRDNLNDIIKYSSGLDSLDDEIISRLASMLSNIELYYVKDESDKILSRLYCEMITSLVQSKPEPWRGHFVTYQLIFRCTFCHKIVLRKFSNHITCLPEQQRINNRGNFIMQHKIDTGWNITKYIKNLMKKTGSWKKVYWSMWGECHFLPCSKCNQYYSVSFPKGCRIHPKEPVFKNINNLRVSPEGVYPCCGLKTYRFDVNELQRQSGCRNINHSPSVGSNRYYSDIQKIYKLIKPFIFTDSSGKTFYTDRKSLHDVGSELSKTHKLSSKSISLLQSQSNCSSWGILDDKLDKLKGYKRFPIGAWQDCQTSIEDRSCLRFSSSESLTDSIIDGRKIEVPPCPKTFMTDKVKKHFIAPTQHNSNQPKDYDEDSNASLYGGEESKHLKNGRSRARKVEKMFKNGRIPERLAENKLKKNVHEMPKVSLRINQDNLRDYEDRLMMEVSSMLCQRINNTSACLIDKFPQISLDTIMKTKYLKKSDMESNIKSKHCHSSDSEISMCSSVKTYCSTISSSTRIYHSRTSQVWNSFIPLAGTFVMVEAEWQDTFNTSMPLKSKAGKKNDECAFMKSLHFQPVVENNRENDRRKKQRTRSVCGKSCRTIKRSWKAMAPKSKKAEIESYLSTTVFPMKRPSVLITPNTSASRKDQNYFIPPCEGKCNLAFTCAFTNTINNDIVNFKDNLRESEYINSIWMYDLRYEELDYLSCTYMPIPLHKDYDVVKGVDWQKLRVLEHEWKSFLKLMKIDEQFKRYFHHSLIKPYYFTDKKRDVLRELNRNKNENDSNE